MNNTHTNYIAHIIRQGIEKKYVMCEEKSPHTHTQEITHKYKRVEILNIVLLWLTAI